MPPEDMYALSGVDIPQSTGEVVAPAGDTVAAYIQRSHAIFVSFEDSQAPPTLDVPDTKRTISRTCDSDWAVLEYFQASNSRCVPLQHVNAEPGFGSANIHA